MVLLASAPILAIFFATVPSLGDAALSDCSPSTLRYDWASNSASQTLQACISPGQSTVFRLDAPLAEGSEALEISPEGRDLELTRGQRSFTVIVPDDFPTGESVVLTARLSTGLAPASVVFRLLVHPSRETRQVRVYLKPRPVEDIEAEARDARAELHQCRQAQTEILAACGSSSELREMLVDEGPYKAKFAVAELVLTRRKDKRSTMILLRGRIARIGRRVTIALKITSKGQSFAKVNQAAMFDKNGQKAPIVPLGEGYTVGEGGKPAWVVLDAVLPAIAQGDKYTLTLWDSTEKQRLIIEGLVVP